MIFGFNTDVKHGETVYHVQSEARERELRLQTQVFVRGQCVAKRATSYADYHARPDFSTEKMHDLLRVQHREVIELVRSGHADQVPSHDAAPHSSSPDEPDPATDHPAALALEWLNPAVFGSANQGAFELHFLVSAHGAAVYGASVTLKLNGVAGPPQYAQATTGSDGRAFVPISFDGPTHGAVVALLAQATSDGRSVTRKFQLRRDA
jgi:hypothetical protein